MKVYADTNFLSYLYLPAEGSAEAQKQLQGIGEPLPITWLLRLELINAIEQSVVTGFAQARVAREHAAAAQAWVREDFLGPAFAAVELPLDRLCAHFEELSLRHTARHGFRTYDILHVASAHLLDCTAFWSRDGRASKLARLEGLTTL